MFNPHNVMINRIQKQIFKKLSKENEIEIEDYLRLYSEIYIGHIVSTLDELKEEEADIWITRVYLDSLE